MSAVRHIDMGFYSVTSAACNKNMGYRSDDSAIRTKDRDYRCVKNGAGRLVELYKEKNCVSANMR